MVVAWRELLGQLFCVWLVCPCFPFFFFFFISITGTLLLLLPFCIFFIILLQFFSYKILQHSTTTKTALWKHMPAAVYAIVIFIQIYAHDLKTHLYSPSSSVIFSFFILCGTWVDRMAYNCVSNKIRFKYDL